MVVALTPGHFAMFGAAKAEQVAKMQRQCDAQLNIAARRSKAVFYLEKYFALVCVGNFPTLPNVADNRKGRFPIFAFMTMTATDYADSTPNVSRSKYFDEENRTAFLLVRKRANLTAKKTALVIYRGRTRLPQAHLIVHGSCRTKKRRHLWWRLI